jgi:hypothetical protein
MILIILLQAERHGIVINALNSNLNFTDLQ